MDPRFLHLYNQELQFVREMGGEFAREYPKIARRLGLDTFDCADPYVERLLEGFAFLAARVQLKIGEEFPRFTQNLLEIVYPQYLAPTPSMAVVEWVPKKDDSLGAQGYTVARGAALHSQPAIGTQTRCEYRTCQDLTLWPILLERASYTTQLGDLAGMRVQNASLGERAALRLHLSTTTEGGFGALSLDRLPLFLRGEAEPMGRLFEQLVGHTVGIAARPMGAQGGPWRLVSSQQPCVRALGLEPEEGILPAQPRSFAGLRLLQEYFAFPERFLFVELCQLAPLLQGNSSHELELVVLFDAAHAVLENSVDANNIRLFCTPVVNLFPHRADRIPLSEAVHEYHVVPDRTRPLDLEIYRVEGVTGLGDSAAVKRDFLPFYAYNHATPAAAEAAYFTLHREARRSAVGAKAKARSSYVGSEAYLSLVDGQEGPYRSDLKQLSVALLCTNRDLPLMIPISQAESDFSAGAAVPVTGVRCVAGPTPPRRSHALGEFTWRLINYLSFNYLALTSSDDGKSAAPLRELLALHADFGEPSLRRQIEGVVQVETLAVVRRLPLPGPVTFARGLAVAVTLDEAAFQGAALATFATVLERFLGQYVSINSFTEMTLLTLQRGEVMRWPMNLGARQVL